MSELSHKPRAATRTRARSPAKRPRKYVTVRTLVDRSTRRLQRAKVFFGHGTDNALDDAVAIVFHALSIAHDATPAIYSMRVGRAKERYVDDLIEMRIEARVPAVYLTHETYFAGLPFFVDQRVLIPRSAIAELIERQFTPWIDPGKVRRVLDLGTGSGCIAVACAVAFPQAKVDAVDIADEALEVARLNVEGHRLTERVRVLKSDHFSALKRQTYDIIVSNPPYVGERELKRLPPEYRHEPRIALAAGRDGLDSVRVILRQAREHLRRRGLLVVEVGNTETAVRKVFPHLPFVWLDFERGGGGVFLLTAEQLDKVS